MQFDKANRLNNLTTVEEKNNCVHSYEKEYYLGASTDDYVCAKCGHILTRSEYNEWREKIEKMER